MQVTLVNVSEFIALTPPPPPGGGRELFGLIFAGYVPLASPSPYPIIVYSVTKYRRHLLGKCNFPDPNLVTS